MSNSTDDVNPAGTPGGQRSLVSKVSELTLHDEERIRAHIDRLGREVRKHRLVQLLFAGLVLGVWQLAGSRMNPLFLPTPSAVVEATLDMWRNGEMGSAVLVSLKVLAVGFGTSILAGVAIGTAMGRYRLAQVILDPYVDALYVMPRIALIPLIIIWFGIGQTGQVVIIVLSATFPVLINTYAGVRAVGRDLLDLAASFGASQRRIFQKFVIPASIPFIMTGIRLGAGRAVLGLIVGQMFLALSGLGALLVQHGNRFQTAHVISTVLHTAILGILVSNAARWLERKVSYWKETERAFGGR